MKRLAALAALVLATGAAIAPANAQRSSSRDDLNLLFSIAANEFISQRAGVDLRQNGNNNGAAVNQAGKTNGTSIYQLGNKQVAQVGQQGRVNRSDVSQYGIANKGAVNQTGNKNYACLIQVGVGLDAEVNQTGRRQSVGVLQTPAGAQDIPPELCFLEKVGRAYITEKQKR